MAFTFPLTISQFMDYLPVSEVSLSAPAQVQIAQTAGGEQLASEVGPQLWRGRITLGRMTSAEARHPDVLLDLLTTSDASFWLYDTRHPAPQMDPTGSILGASAPTIYSLDGNNRDMRLQGLPVGYVLKRGDFIAFDYGGRRALHRVVSTSIVTASTGITPTFEVLPKIRPGALVGAAVTLRQASCKAKLIPGQLDKGNARAVITDGMSFQFIQTLK
jgi:hypothetical protein